MGTTAAQKAWKAQYADIPRVSTDEYQRLRGAERPKTSGGSTWSERYADIPRVSSEDFRIYKAGQTVNAWQKEMQTNALRRDMLFDALGGIDLGADQVKRYATLDYGQKLLDEANAAYDKYLEIPADARDEKALGDATRAYHDAAIRLQDWEDRFGKVEDIRKQMEEAQRYEDWRKVPRSTKDVQAELTKLTEEIETWDRAYGERNADRNPWKKDEALSIMGGKIDELQKRKERLEQEAVWARGLEYEDLKNAPDFAEKSKYVANGDRLYELVNGNEAEKNAIHDKTFGRVIPSNTGVGGPFGDLVGYTAQLAMASLKYESTKGVEAAGMSDDERATYNYIYATEGPEAAEKYYDFIQSELYSRRRQLKEMLSRAFADTSPAAASAVSVLETPFRSLGYVGQAADFLADGKLTKDAPYNQFSYTSTAIRDQVAKKAEAKWGPTGSFLYQTGMSMADFLYTTIISGCSWDEIGAGATATEIAAAQKSANLAEWLSLAIMGTGAAADTTIKALDRGLTDGQAFSLGTIAGLAEVISEKISLDVLLHPDWEKGAIVYVLKSGFFEGLEEVNCDLINTFADIMISKEKSEWRTAVRAYRQQGMDEDDAFWHAALDQAETMGLDFLGGAISGAVMAGGKSAGHVYNYYNTGAELRASDFSRANIQDLIDIGRHADMDMEARRAAMDAQAKLDAGKELSNYELGQLYDATLRVLETGRVNMPSFTVKDDSGDVRASDRTQDQAWQTADMVSEALEGGAEVNENGLNAFTPQEQAAFASEARNQVVSTFQDALTFVENELSTKQSLSRAYLGRITASAAQLANTSTGLNIDGYTAVMYGNDVRHIFNRHGNAQTEAKRGQIAVTAEDIALIPEILSHPDKISPPAAQNGNGRQTITFEKQIGDRYITVQTILEGKNTLRTDTMQIQQRVLQAADLNAESRSEIDELSEPELSQPGAEANTGDWNASQLVAAMDRLGPEGQRAAGQGYNGANNQAYYNAFAAYYQAGMAGLPMDQVRSQFSETLTEAQRAEAWQAGHADAVNSLNADIQAAPVRGDTTGNARILEEAVATGVLTEVEADTLATLADAASVKVEFVDTLGDRNGKYDPATGTVQIALDADDPAVTVAAHEVTHRLRETSPATYRQFRDMAVRASMEATGGAYGTNYAADWMADFYGEHGLNINTEEAMDEIAANYAQELVESRQVFQEFANKKPGLARRALNALKGLLRRVRSIIHGNVSNSDSRVDVSPLQEAARIWEQAVREAENVNWSTGNPAVDEALGLVSEGETEERFSLKNDDFTMEDAEKVQKIGRVSINDFTSEQIRASEKFAQKYWRELGIKSPFFRAWFGDWRANDQTPVKVVNVTKGAAYKPGRTVNADTGRDISWGERLSRETYVHRRPNGIAPEIVGDIKSIAENAIMLDTEVSVPSSKSKMRGTSFMHSMYCVVNDGGVVSLIKLYAEEAVPVKGGEPFTRAYELKDIEKVATIANGALSHAGGLTKANVTTIDTVADLFSAVKALDKDFHPKPASKAVDENGNPKVYYHGTNANWTAYDLTKNVNQMWGEGIYLAESPERAKAYGDHVMPFYVQALHDNRDAKRLGVERDHVRMKNTGDLLVFSPEQIKSATDNIGTFDRSNPDIRYSLKDSARMEKRMEAMAKQIKMLEDRLEYQKSQTRLSERTTTERKAVRAEARTIIRETGARLSPTETADFTNGLQEMYDYMTGNGGASDQLTFTGVRQRAERLAAMLVDHAVEVDDQTYQQYKDLRSYMRTTPFTISAEDAANIPDFKEWRKAIRGRVRLSVSEHTNIDQRFQEMTEMWPELFDAEQITHPADQLMRIADVAEGIFTVTETNPYSINREQAITGIANELIERFYDLPQTRPNFADRQAAKLEAERSRLRAETREAVKQAAEQERENGRKALKRMEDHYNKLYESRLDSEARTRLLKLAKKMKSMKTTAANRAEIDALIGDLDTVAKSMTGKTLQQLYELQDWYDEQKEDPDFIPDPRTEETLKRLSRRQIAELSKEDVIDLTQALLNIENEIRTSKKLIDMEDRRETFHLGEEVIRDLQSTRGSKATGVGMVLDRFIVTETLSPVRQVRRMTGYIDSDPMLKLTNALADGQRVQMEYQMKAEKPFQRFAEDEKFASWFSGRYAEGIKVTGMTPDGLVEVTITPAMRTALYLHSLNTQNLRHIAEGGVTIPNWELYQKGKLQEAYDHYTNVRFSPSQLQTITSKMTAQEKAFAREAIRYFEEVSKPAINEVSVKLKGYEIAQVENYYPIDTNRDFSKRDFEALKYDGTLEGAGYLQKRLPYAAGPIVLFDADSTVSRSIKQHAKFVGLAIPVRNFNKVWGVTKYSFNEDGSRNGYESSVQKAVREKWGSTGYNYLEKMMTDLQNGRPAKDAWGKGLDKLRSNYAGAVLTLNGSVAMKQAASYPTAAAVLGWKPLFQAFSDVGRVDLDLIAKYTPLQWYRSKGFSTQELGDLASGQRSRYKGLDWAKGKNLPKGLNWVQGADLLTTRKLWKASEFYVRDNQKSLTRGSDSYYKAVAEVYNRVIEETQPNYTVMQRPQLLRSDNVLLQNLNMFKTQPFQNFNILYDAAENLAAKTRQFKAGTITEATLKEARTTFRRAVTSQLAQLVTFAAMTAGWSLLRGKKDKYKDKETGEIAFGSFSAAIAKDMAGGLASDVPFGSDAWEFASSKLFGDKYYGMDAVTVSALQDTLSAIGNLGELVSGAVKKAADGEPVNWNSFRLSLDRDADNISKAMGVPYENVMNLVNMAARWVLIGANGEYLGEYGAMRMTTDPEKYSADYYDLLYRAMREDDAAYRELYDRMIEDGFDADKLRNAMEKRMKDAQGVKSVGDLEQRYLPPDKHDYFDELVDALMESKVWNAANEDQRKSVTADIYDLVMETSAGQKLQQKIDGGAGVGLAAEEYVEYLLSLAVADKPTESGKYGTYTNDEVEAAILAVSGLTDDERSYLWTSQGKSSKSDPWG